MELQGPVGGEGWSLLTLPLGPESPVGSVPGAGEAALRKRCQGWARPGTEGGVFVTVRGSPSRPIFPQSDAFTQQILAGIY